VDWMNSKQVQTHLQQLGSHPSSASLPQIYGLSKILSNSLPAVDFCAPKGFSDLAPPSSYAGHALSKLHGAEKLSEDTKAFVGFITFFHRDHFVDYSRVQVEELMECVDTLLTQKKITVPDRHGRTLYDRFNVQPWGDRLEFLEPIRAAELIEGTETGVYQLGNIVTGPLGILLSNDRRLSAPQISVPLWHCEDPGCGMIHSVKLLRHPVDSFRLRDELRTSLTKSEGPSSEWQYPFHGLLRERGPKAYYDLLPLIADAVPAIERTQLFSALLGGTNGAQLRSIVAARINPKASQGHPDQVASRLSPGTQLQLISVLEDTTIITALDDAVRSDVIKIPQSEVRKVNVALPKLNRTDMPCSFSLLGVRADRPHASRFLSSLIYGAYKSENATPDLLWRASIDRGHPAAVFEYVQRQGPREAIRKLIAPSRGVAGIVGARIKSKAPAANQTSAEEDVILWKSGFDVARHEQKYGKFRESLTTLRECSLQASVRLSDSERNVIRGSAVNAFVSAENFIEEIVSYAVWLLSSDHFTETNLSYSFESSVRSVPNVLGVVRLSDQSEMSWNPSGGNTFGTLLSYARAASDWMQSLSGADRKLQCRSKQHFPHYTRPDDELFPFHHTSLWADAEPSELIDFARQFDAIVKILEQSRVAEIRNGIGHYRDNERFPLTDAILACESRLTSALELADVSRFIPKMYWVKSMNTEEFGISECVLEDYLARKFRVSAPQVMKGLISPKFGTAYVIPAGNLLGKLGSTLILNVREESLFRKTWDNYPPRSQLQTLGITQDQG
jgi:hypothetical protein